ncbi:MAG TPA: metalloregulator ArsR/SmtB family transcription factor [Acidimicrobiales bacterium]|jgi:DNA-binding transcriptional ArsR family regulator|nr:metalloregulator ArsR/SmtB family transcription factor [Acidimicrobiales bacterium]
MDAVLKALAEERRRTILRLVWSREMTASDIAAHFDDVTRPAISQHLGVLREARLVVERRDGVRRFYRADHAEMANLRAFLDEFWTSGLDRLRDAAEAAERAKRSAQPTRETGSGKARGGEKSRKKRKKRKKGGQ